MTNGGFQLLMLGAMYENGGNVTHRLLDGHPELFVYPFESQLGTSLVSDHLSSMFPVKYRWPVFDLEGTPDQDYCAIFDEECKVRARTPHVSKFRHMPFHFSDDERRAAYRRYVSDGGRSRANNVAAFFRATFDAWTNYKQSGKETVYVGYSPIITVDAGTILREMLDAQVLHVVRNPWSAYAETKRRPVPLSLEQYMLGWAVTQHHALVFKEQFPERMHILRLEDILHDPYNVLGSVCRKIGVNPAESLKVPSWNGMALEEVYPWGTIRKATPEDNRAAAEDLTERERQLVREWASPYLAPLGYADVIDTPRSAPLT